MAKNKQRGAVVMSDPLALQARVERLLVEHKFQHGLELARTLHRMNATPQSVQLLVQAAFGRARQLTATNHQNDAAAVLASVATFVQSPGQTEELALALSECGHLELALRVAKPLASPALQGRLLGKIADAALRTRALPGSGLPADFLGQRDLIVQAFAQAEAGQDDEARATLQGIGLTSPFLEWKLLLRGLIAYYVGDDAKALDNWQRLDPQRLPAQLAAPLRQAIDQAYRQSQPQETQKLLLRRFELWHAGSTLSSRLRQVQLAIADPDNLADAFRKAESLLPALKTEAPELARRLATCFYWAIISHGYPEDLSRYHRVFGDPRDDPGLFRLQALAVEQRGGMDIAIEAWKDYEKSIAKNAASLPAGYAARMRALVWHRIAEDAMQLEDEPEIPDFNAFKTRPRPRPTDPEACLKRSLELAPDQLEVHFELVQYYLDNHKQGKALQAAKKLLKQFPEHVPTLEMAGSLSLRKGDLQEAIDFYGRAVQANPLKAELRSMLGLSHTTHGLQLAAGKHFAAARLEFQSALKYCEGDNETAVLCGWAGMEFKAGDAALGEEIVQKSATRPGNRLATSFVMLIMTISKKLGKPLKTRFETEVKRLLSEPATTASACSLCMNFAALSSIRYVGQKTHQKMVLTYLDKAPKGEFSEKELADICGALKALQAKSHLQRFFALGQSRFPANPQFYLAEVDYHLSLAHRRRPVWKTRRLLAKVRELAAGLPPDQRAALLSDVEEREDQLGGSDFGRFLMGNPMDGFLPDDDFDEDEGEEEFDWSE